MTYRVYQDARGKWNIQDTFTDRVIAFKFKSKKEADEHLRLVTELLKVNK